MAEACSFRDSYEDLRGLGAEVIGVSADSPESHLAFARKFDLPFVLLSNPGNDVRKKLGVPGSLFGLLAGVFTALDDRINGLILAQPIIMECLMKSKMAKMSAAT